MEIGSHSLIHSYMTILSTEQLLIELKDSKAQIAQQTGKEVVSFAYPFGDCSGRTHKVATEVGYKNNYCNHNMYILRMIEGVRIYGMVFVIIELSISYIKRNKISRQYLKR